MEIVDRNSVFWSYLTPEIAGLIEDSEMLISFVEKSSAKSEISDFSFLVFPIAKAYEGYLKKLFLDIGMIKPDEYYSDDIRIGRILNPHYQEEKGNVFALLCSSGSNKRDLSERLWAVWKRGRNLVFHYFPHNFRKLKYEEAIEIIREFVQAMEAAATQCSVPETLFKSKTKEKISSLKS